MKFISSRMALIALLMLAGAGLAVAMKPTQKMADLHGMPDLNVMVPENFGGWTLDRSIVPIEPSPDVKAIINKVYNRDAVPDLCVGQRSADHAVHGLRRRPE